MFKVNEYFFREKNSAIFILASLLSPPPLEANSLREDSFRKAHQSEKKHEVTEVAFFFSYQLVAHLFSPEFGIQEVGEDHPPAFLTML